MNSVLVKEGGSGGRGVCFGVGVGSEAERRIKKEEERFEEGVEGEAQEERRCAGARTLEQINNEKLVSIPFIWELQGKRTAGQKMLP